MLQQQRVTTDAPTNWGATDATNGTADLTQFISFAIGDDQYGVDIMAVREIKGWSRSAICRGSPTMCAACSTCAASWSRSSICAAASARA